MLDEALSKVTTGRLATTEGECSFLAPSLIYLGHLIMAMGLYPLTASQGNKDSHSSKKCH